MRGRREGCKAILVSIRLFGWFKLWLICSGDNQLELLSASCSFITSPAQIARSQLIIFDMKHDYLLCSLIHEMNNGMNDAIPKLSLELFCHAVKIRAERCR